MARRRYESQLHFDAWPPMSLTGLEDAIAMQQGQVFRLKRCGRDGESQWAYRYRTGGRESRRIQRGGFASEQHAVEALEGRFRG